MPVVETTNTFLVEEVIKTKITQKLPEHKCVWIKKLKVFLELLIYDRIWGVLKGQKPLGNVWSVHVIGIFRGVERGGVLG